MNINEILTKSSFVVPKATRTLFFNKKPIRLKLPELTFFQDYYDLSVWIIKDNIPHYVPLPNIYLNGKVCLPLHSGDLTTNIDEFFNSSFKLGLHPSNTYTWGFYLQHQHLTKYITKYKTIPFKIKVKEEIICDFLFRQETLQFYLDNLIKAEENDCPKI